ncbi:MAG: Maf family nucleotide pyrophosphatase [Bacteroidia bacterium]
MEKKIILASKSPRRQELIKGLELDFEIHLFDTDENFPEGLRAEQIALFLAGKKADDCPFELKENEILLTADTIVWINGMILNKPLDEDDAFRMLKIICGNMHEVFTGVCLRSKNKSVTFYERSEVYCKKLSDEDTWYYIKNFKPLDKAGSYGIQDWFGYTAVEKINGCFYNVMGLPVSRVYEELKKFD